MTAEQIGILVFTIPVLAAGGFMVFRPFDIEDKLERWIANRRIARWQDKAESFGCGEAFTQQIMSMQKQNYGQPLNLKEIKAAYAFATKNLVVV